MNLEALKSLIIDVEVMNDNFTKYHLHGGRVLHHFKKATDVEYHDHPWGFTSTILKGGYVEEILQINGVNEPTIVLCDRHPGDTHEVEHTTIHRIIRHLDGEVWTLVQPREWKQMSGFYKVENGKVMHRFWNSNQWHTFKSFC